MSIHRYKVVLLGDSKVGKTVLTTIDTQSSYTKQYQPTLPCNLTVKSIRIPNSQPLNTVVELHLYDLSGNLDLFKRLYPSYLKDSHGLIVCYDLSERDTFDHISKWYELYQQYEGQNHNHEENEKSMISCIVGLKSEMRENGYACCTMNEAEELSLQYNAKYMECSAAMNRDTDLPFNYIADALYHRYNKQQSSNMEHEAQTSTGSNVKTHADMQSHQVEGEVF